MAMISGCVTRLVRLDERLSTGQIVVLVGLLSMSRQLRHRNSCGWLSFVSAQELGGVTRTRRNQTWIGIF